MILDKFKKNDEEIDGLLDKIIGGLSNLNEKAGKIGVAIDEQRDHIVKAQKGID